MRLLNIALLLAVAVTVRPIPTRASDAATDTTIDVVNERSTPTSVFVLPHGVGADRQRILSELAPFATRRVAVRTTQRLADGMVVFLIQPSAGESYATDPIAVPLDENAPVRLVLRLTETGVGYAIGVRSLADATGGV